MENEGLVSIEPEHIRIDIVNAARPMMEKRSLYKDYLARKYMPESIAPLLESTGIANILPGEGNFSADGAFYNPAWQPLSWTNPATGQRYQTTRRSAEKADVDNKKKELTEAAGIAGATALAYKALANRYPAVAAPLLVGGGVLAVVC